MAGHTRDWPISKPSSEVAARMAVILAVIGCQRAAAKCRNQSGALNSMIKRLNAASILSILLAVTKKRGIEKRYLRFRTRLYHDRGCDKCIFFVRMRRFLSTFDRLTFILSVFKIMLEREKTKHKTPIVSKIIKNWRIRRIDMFNLNYVINITVP